MRTYTWGEKSNPEHMDNICFSLSLLCWGDVKITMSVGTCAPYMMHEGFVSKTLCVDMNFCRHNFSVPLVNAILLSLKLFENEENASLVLQTTTTFLSLKSVANFLAKIFTLVPMTF